MFGLEILVFLSFALLFFIVTLFTGNKIRMIIFNVIFVVLTYISISMLVGQPKPVVRGIPLYSSEKWVPENTEVRGYWWDKQRIYLMVKVGNDVNLYAFPEDDKFLDRLKQVIGKMNEAGKDGVGFGLSSNGDGWTSITLPAPQTNQIEAPKTIEPPATETQIR